MTEGTSILIDLLLPDAAPVRVRFHILDVQGEPNTRISVRGQFRNVRGEELRRLLDLLSTLDEEELPPLPAHNKPLLDGDG